MISLASPPLTALTACSREPGGFVWWYADLSNAAGDALVLIWSLGLPFLPRAEGRGPALSRPALSLALYRQGRAEFYLLQDYERASVPVTIGGHPLGDGRLGDTRFRTSKRGALIELAVDLSEPVPGSRERLMGSLVVTGHEHPLGEEEGLGEHLWAPRIVHGVAQTSLRVGRERFELSGAGYFDSNFARVPLAEQGIARWLWGRVAFADRTFTYYRTEADSGQIATRVLSQHADGSVDVEFTSLELSRPAWGAYGLRAPRRIAWSGRHGQVELELGAPVEDGPFYQRFLLRGRSESAGAGHGIAELVVPGRLGIRWQQPLVRMRTHAVGGRNSFWLPLFSGTRRGRVRRLLGLEAA